ncbi:alpha/beta fold hydrolase [Allokutzneria sp. NRRL B-24872]|uniref:alpha/beta fold hydrolase n=1 Tax=Allokutzneria sp. NRRL B-24872 TaxID=1137961 RepID=UPI000A3AEBCE|nr:alpha/beta fold hydrolase [Allokutzneria sp. NRRL B-24872]
MVTQRDIEVGDGRVVRTYDTGGEGPVVVWHPGSPTTGALFAPLPEIAAEHGVRMVSYARPSYASSTPHPGRAVASAAADVERIVDALGIERFATMGYSGGGPHAFACAAVLSERVTAAAGLASLAPYNGEEAWFSGMVAEEGLRSALKGRAARAAYAEVEEFDPDIFTAADWAALSGAWAELGADAGQAGAAGHDGLVDDDVAFAEPWGFDLKAVSAPVLLVQGADDRVVPPAHADLLARELPGAELWARPGEGHVSVLNACSAATAWLLANARH